ncbi:hypothetical protein RS030_162539 [Cryptosporidium xiaoi]|uniref:Uncharacterized protein n=1 Tax=Cryptosporidium xiaoi TaxID=659607 RepID=A0AAV9Y1U1_9CRYT
MILSDKGYIGLNDRLLNEYEKEEALDTVSEESIIDSQYVYFNSTNKGELLVYNKLSNVLFRVGDGTIVEYELPELYKQEFDSRPLHLLLYVKDELSQSLEKEKIDTEGYLSYILEDFGDSRKILVYRKIRIVGNKVYNGKCIYNWIENEYMECKISLNDEELRGIIWWNFDLNFLHSNNLELFLNLDDNNESIENNSQKDPSILLITSEKLRLYSLKDRSITLNWEIVEKNSRVWYNIEFQCVLLQVSQNKLLPYVNIGLKEDQRPVQLQTLELSINNNLLQKDILLISIYNNLYCMHIDNENSRISLRNLLNHENSDLVLDINDSFKEFNVIKLDNLIIVLNLHGDKTFSIYDIKLLLSKKNTKKGLSEHECSKSSNIEDSNDSERNSRHDKDSMSDGYYIVPSLFTDRFKKNTIICMYKYDNTNYYKRLAGDNRNALDSSTIVLFDSSMNLVMRIFVNRIQYSKLILSEKELLGSLVNINGKKGEKLQLLPFVLNRTFISYGNNTWDFEFINRIRELYEIEKKASSSGSSSGNNNNRNIMSLVMYVLELIKLKLDVKQDIKNIFYWLLLEMLFYMKNEPLLHNLLQYHIIHDSNRLLIELFNLYLYNTNSENEKKKVRFELDFCENEKCITCSNKISLRENYFSLKNKLWLEQICLDVAYRLRNIDIITKILMIRREYREIIKFLRFNSQQKIVFNLNDDFKVLENAILKSSKKSQASKFPIYTILYKVGTDIDELNCNPNILIDLIKQVKCWINDYNCQIDLIMDKVSLFKQKNSDNKFEKVNVFIIGKPNLHKCSVWLPELIDLDTSERNGWNEGEGDDCNSITSSDGCDCDYIFCCKSDGIHHGEHQHGYFTDDKSIGSKSELDIYDDNFRRNCQCEPESDKNNLNFYSTYESVYVSAVESNETLTNNPINDGRIIENKDIETYSSNDNLNKSILNNSGKSPILHLQSKILIQNEYDELDSSSSSYTSSSRSSFNSYE